MSSFSVSSLASVYAQLTNFANLSNFWSLFNTAFGSSYDFATAASLRSQWQSGNFSSFPQIEIVSNSILKKANGAYAISTNKIYLSDQFLSAASQQSLDAVLIEEFGHFVDAQINTSDSAGDEGAIFAALVAGDTLNAQTLANLRTENDYTNIIVNGENLAIEQSTVITTDLNTITAAQLVSTLLGSGIIASNVTFTGANVAGGIFSGGIGAGLGIENGIILSTGDIAFAQELNDSTSRGLSNGTFGDADLDTIVNPLFTNDAAVLEFDFIPSSTTASFSYVFASEEYFEFVDTSFNDVFAFYLNGQNIALIPGTTTPVSINNLNAGNSFTPLSGNNSSFFIPNYETTFDTQFDGFTTVLSAVATNLVAGVTNRIKLAIADTGDFVLDSAVFLQSASFGNPTLVTVVATDSAAGEGATPNLGVFTITRTGTTANSLTVNYTISGTASSTDYNTIASTVIISAGQASTTITITPVDDNLIEGNETIILSLIDTASYDLGATNSAVLVIADNEAQNTVVNLSVAPASVVEDGTANLVYTFIRQGATTIPLTINYNVGGSATLNTDYIQIGAGSFSNTTGTIAFAVGVSTATVTINPTSDTSMESNETVALTLASGIGYTIGTATAVTGTIIDDDTPVVTVAINPTSVLEDGAGNLVYTFTRTGNTATALTVNYGVSGTATLNTDYVQTGAATFTSTVGSIIFAAGSSISTLTINPTADTTIESAETVALILAPNAGYKVGTTTAVTGTITNDDFPSITLAVAPASVLEDGAPNLIYTLTRTGATNNALTVNYGITGTATNGTDYATIGTSVAFAANSATAIVTVNPTADTVIEANETVALTLATGTGYTIGTTTVVTGTITNDDTTTASTVTLAVNYNGISENSPSNFIYTFTRAGVTTNVLTVNYSIAGTAATSDYIGATPGTGKTINFAVGSATATLNLDSIGDTTIETDETISLQLATGTGYSIGTTAAQIGTIINDDGTRRQKGTSGKDVILGTNLSDILSGGLGNDILTGSDGGDSFSFNATNEGIDTITDFSAGSDYLLIKGSAFGGSLISGDIITSAQFIIGTTATNASQRFVYNSINGALLFDVDGNGATSAIQFATLNPKLALTFEDIFVI